jgi:hypothetical protein
LLRHRTASLEATLKQSKNDLAARLLLARTAWHSPPLGPKDATGFLPAADVKRPFAQRTRGGLLLRQKKPTEAVPALEEALKNRGDDAPPVEELLVAWAYLHTGQTVKAKALWAKAARWLDSQQEALRAVDLARMLPAGRAARHGAAVFWRRRIPATAPLTGRCGTRSTCSAANSHRTSRHRNRERLALIDARATHRLWPFGSES